MRTPPNLIHNGTSYSINIPRFLAYCANAKDLFSDGARLPVTVTDILTSAEFSVLAAVVNSTQPNATAKTVIPLLKSSLVWSAPSFVTLCVDFLLSFGDSLLIVQAINLSNSGGVTFENLEQHCADKLAVFLPIPEFAALPVAVLVRILTWYGATIPRGSQFVRFVLNSFKENGRIANFLLEFVNFADIPEAELPGVMRLVDVDLVGDRVMRELSRTKGRDRAIAKQAIDNERARVSKLKLQLDSVMKKVQANKEKVAAAGERRLALGNEIGKADAELKRVVADLKSREKEKEGLTAAVAAARVRLEEARREKDEALEGLESARREAAERTARRTMAMESVVPANSGTQYHAEDLVGRIRGAEEDFVIVWPKLLKEELPEEEDARCAFLDYLWRGVEMRDVVTSSCYGALLATEDEFSDDLAVSVLKIASRMGDVDAIWNLAVMAKLGRGVRGDDGMVAELLARAANGGHPTAMAVAKRIGGGK
jgi:hypothetical protein